MLHEPFLPFIPTAPSRVLDVGAGIGRDAVELSTRGHDVIAVEPLPAFRAEAKRLFPDANVHWIGDSLPMLRHVRSIARSRGISQRFDFVLASAVWHHLDDGQ
ncbi:MAG: class I SAM-dependent methyltransferase, partial [Myxococcota bacterium]